MHFSLRGTVVRRVIKYILSISGIILHVQVGCTYTSLDVAASFFMERNTSLPCGLLHLVKISSSQELICIPISPLKIKEVSQTLAEGLSSDGLVAGKT